MSQEVAPRVAGTPLKNKVKDLLPTSGGTSESQKRTKIKRYPRKLPSEDCYQRKSGFGCLISSTHVSFLNRFFSMQEMIRQSRLETRIDTRGSEKISRIAKEAEFRLENLRVGQWIEGQVMRIVGHGSWVDVGAQCDGFIHVNDLRDRFVQKATDELSPGQSIKVCLKFSDASTKTPGLSCLDVSSRARLGVTLQRTLDTFSQEEQVWGEVTKVTNFGAFIDVGAEVEGFLHVSECPERLVSAF
jgi:predicted RNA-binding protein with RPS1 domain